ncbi:MAG TPA: PAS domain S-box protein [Gammaproteobacteria bacterium]|nr:PAS domain S-box protein [Gammaproteobacteria bacterium]
MPRQKIAQTETQTYLELAEILCMTLAPDGEVLHINPYGALLAGYEPAEIIGRRWVENFVPASYRGDIETVFRAALMVGTEDSLHFQNPVLTKDGREIMIYWHYRCLRDERSEITRVVCTGIDVTGRSQAERNLEKVEARANAVLDSVVDAIINIDAVGTIQMFNPAAVKMFGYSEAEVLGKNVSLLMGRPHREKHDGYIHNYLNTGDAKIIGIGRELMALRKNGTEFPIHLTVSEVRGSGQRSFTGIIRDLTELRESERRLRQRDEEILETRERLAHMERLSTFNAMTAGIAHELNQPLAAITIYAQACYRLVDASMDEPELKRALKKIDDQVGRAAQVIRRLRTLVNKRESVREATHLNRLIEETVEIVRIDGRSRDVRFDSALEPLLPPVQVDPVQIQQVLLNLLLNSVDALEAREPAERAIHIGSALLPEGAVRVSVRDNGIGLMEESRDRIFSPFFSTKSKGMGMGLHISHTIVTAHGGNLGYNAVNPGTEFYFILPLNGG